MLCDRIDLILDLYQWDKLCCHIQPWLLHRVSVLRIVPPPIWLKATHSWLICIFRLSRGYLKCIYCKLNVDLVWITVSHKLNKWGKTLLCACDLNLLCYECCRVVWTLVSRNIASGVV